MDANILSAAVTKNGIVKLAAPEPLDLTKVTSDKKIEDKDILEILATPITVNAKKNKRAAKAAAGEKKE